ncbi:hypothetical protein D1007_61423 [Hordeum vulgare]|nr:hypothetical protein D1007_61423 [Hordeum vulgare]
MDPVLKAYLDNMSDEAAARANKKDSATNTILQAVATQTARIDTLITWKPELEARFAHLELSVAALQATSPPTTTSNGSPQSRARSTGNQATTHLCTPGSLRR